jgi:hypothetical protein
MLPEDLQSNWFGHQVGVVVFCQDIFHVFLVLVDEFLNKVVYVWTLV